MSVRVDAAGNLRGVYPATRADAPRLFIGSHLDTVPRAGAFDGVLGVVLGVALVELLDGRRLPFAIEVVGFSEEEGVRFGVPFIGSRALAGTLDAALLERRDAAGVSVREAIRAFGLDPDAHRRRACADRRASAISSSTSSRDRCSRASACRSASSTPSPARAASTSTFTGAANHAGTTPMTPRRDALAGAAEWIVAVEREARRTPGLRRHGRPHRRRARRGAT